MRIPIALVSLLVATSAAWAQPRVNSVLNNYSYVLPGLPNYGIAQGSLFHIFGTGVGPAQTPTLPDLSKGPLQTNLNGVIVSVTVGGTTKQCPLYFVSATDIAGVLPSDTPVGTGTITVQYNGQTSATAPITVVQSAFGMLTLSGSGSGAAAVFNASNGNGYVTPATAANPGETLTIWGSGIGPSANSDTTFPVAQTDLKNTLNVRVYIGGQQATVAYAGRSQFPGLDQINVVVPANAIGCTVPVVVQTGTVVSNTASISVAASGRVCSDAATSGLTSTELQTILAKGSFRVGSITLDKTTTQTPGLSVGGVTLPSSTSTSDSAGASFAQYTPQQLAAGGTGNLSQTSMGSCTVYQFQGTSGSTPTFIPPNPLDAGTITMRLPDGSTRNLTKDAKSGYYSLSGSNAQGSTTPLFIPNAGGQFSFTNSGGTDVGAISGAQITMPPALNWTNMDAITTINRAQGVTVNWSTSNPYNGFVTIQGSSFSLNGTGNNATTTFTLFTCTAPYSAGTFTVPSYVTLAMVQGGQSVGGITIPTGSLTLSLNAPPVKFTAPSIDYSVLYAISGTGKSVTYQ